jgi:hypothetical protein
MKKGETEKKSSKKVPVSSSPEEREQRCINLAEKMAEEQLANGTASAQVQLHYLKLGSQKAKLETEKLRHETELIRAKTADIEAQKRSDQLFEEAIKAFKGYSGIRDE